MRLRIIFIFFLLGFITIVLRLFYWQILNADIFAARADAQHWVTETLIGHRGMILARDGFPLARGETAYILYADKSAIDIDDQEFANVLAPILYADASSAATRSATPSASPQEEIESIKTKILTLLRDPTRLWVKLSEKMSGKTKEILEQSALNGLVFQPAERRVYPEASMAAHVLGFVGANDDGEDQGYYGIEGKYHGELRGRQGRLQQERDAAGRPILIGGQRIEIPEDGRNIRLTIERAIQFMAEQHLAAALEKYGASAGSIVIMDPHSGAIRAMASLPSYDPQQWQAYPSELYRNPIIAETYEPGSTLKVIIMAAAFNEGVVDEKTICPVCSGPRQIGGFTIRTWNDVYHPDASMRDILRNSDNVGMVFVGEKLGVDTLWKYLKAFGLLEQTGIELQEEENSSIRPRSQWRPIDLATASFGQGIAVTAIQMIRAVGAIANNGVLMQPYVVFAIEDQGHIIPTEPKVTRRVIKPAVAQTMMEMMVDAVEHGEAKWTRLHGYRIAGKTGTASIPLEGHYDEEKTIASFVGFAPADNPTFVMLVTLREPSTSPWAAETAAPLFFDVAQDLLRYDGIAPIE